MTHEKAREILREFMQKYYADEEYPLVWVGDVEGEDGDEYLIRASIYNENEPPEKQSDPYGVNRETGEIDLRLIEEA